MTASFPQKIRAYINLTRPFTLLAPLIATVFGILMSMLYHGEPARFWENWHVVMFTAITMAMVQMCGQIINQSEDPIGLDVINNKSYRPIPRGIITQPRARGMGLLIGLSALIISFILNIPFGLGITLLLFFAIFYSMEPIRAKKRRIIGTLWLGISRGLLPLLVVWSVFYFPFEDPPLLLCVVLFLWVSGFQVTKDFPDIKGDKEYKIPTFPVSYGMKKTKFYMHLMNGLSFGTLIIYILIRVLPPSFALVLILHPIGTLVITRIREDSQKLKLIENSVEWMFFYIGLSLFYILFTVALVIT